MCSLSTQLQKLLCFYQWDTVWIFERVLFRHLVFQTKDAAGSLKCVSLCDNASSLQGGVSFWSHTLTVISLRRGRQVDIYLPGFWGCSCTMFLFDVKCCISSTSSPLTWNTGITYAFFGHGTFTLCCFGQGLNMATVGGNLTKAGNICIGWSRPNSYRSHKHERFIIKKKF